MSGPSESPGPEPGDPPVAKGSGPPGPALDRHDLRLLKEYEQFLENNRPSSRRAFHEAIARELVEQRVERQRRQIEAVNNTAEAKYGHWPVGALRIHPAQPAAGESSSKPVETSVETTDKSSKTASSGSRPEGKPRTWVRKTVSKTSKSTQETMERTGKTWVRRHKSRVVESSSEHKEEASPETPMSPSCESLATVSSQDSEAVVSTEAMMVRELLQAAAEPDNDDEA